MPPLARTPLSDGQIISSQQSLEGVPFPFGPDFQVKLIKVLMMDDTGDLILEHIKPGYFESPEMRWTVSEIQTYRKQYSTVPTWTVLKHRASSSADQKMRPTILQMLDYQENMMVKEEQWIRSQVMDWVRQNIFHIAFKETKGLWDHGKRTEAIDHMSKEMDKINEALWTKIDRGWFFEELSNREQKRIHDSVNGTAIVTGIAELDKVLAGGLSPGEMGIWIAYAKGGKSTMLMNHGAMAIRAQFRKVLHFVLEGSRSLIENRYDAWFADEHYNTVKQGGMGPKVYAALFQEYQYLKTKLVIRGLVEEWNYTAVHLHAELKDLRKHYGWIPDLIIVDYGDLIRGRETAYQAPWMSERDAFRDLKSISNRGYALWTASQAQRPEKKGYDVTEHIIKASMIAGGIEKVRVADFVGSLNATLEEQAKGCARVYAELYRDNEAGKVISILTELSKMKMGVGLAPSPSSSVGTGPSLGYKSKVAA